jgi:tetratricopeptide (TPR) repeat protein
MKLASTLAFTLAGVIWCAPWCQFAVAQQQETPAPVDGPMTENPIYDKSTKAPRAPANRAAPRSDDESSSNQTRIDLSPPANDSLAHPNGGYVTGMDAHEWNPLRAMKDVEVGDYYFRNGNYKAALSRYREALQFKPRDAAATFKLAQALEKVKDFEEARIRYQEYLAILKDGPSAGEAKKALARLQKQ